MNRWYRYRAWLLLGVPAAFLADFGYLASRVWIEAGRNEARPAAVIVVFGAAEYRGRPSPVLRGRLDRALELYRRGLAGIIITTGGPGGDPDFTEAGVARNYLVAHGVPPESILVEDESASTSQTILDVVEIMSRHGMRTCLVVSDGYHLFRIKRHMRSKGIEAYGVPREVRVVMPVGLRVWATVKQVLGYMLWRIGVLL
ncbi:MAG: YdcF family protein [Acidobacteria bacterium]|jgi:uncharacterized SAM-binding protein YcdF (DUF218 family)|nr:YdcF family protein [Acidobacteriota bacterium]